MSHDSADPQSGTDFLKLGGDRTLKTHIRNINDSYSNSWDVLSELAQNAVDAIRTWNAKYPNLEKDHKIAIRISQNSNTISFKDSGIGIAPDRAPELLAPDATDKYGDPKTIGEKGVGLTFCIFCSNNFKIDTKSPVGYYQGQISGARTWRTKFDDDVRPRIQGEQRSDTPIDPMETGTTITLDDVRINEGEIDIFDLTPERLKYLLRTRTAIGNTKKPFPYDEPEIDVTLEVHSNEEPIIEDVDYEYWFPDQFWDEDEIVDIYKFKNQPNIDKLTDEQKRKQLKDKCWLVKGEVERKHGSNVRYYGLFVPSKKVWDRISRQNELYEDQDDEQFSDIEPGIYVSTRGMPTGVKIDRPDTGSAGYWDQFYLLLGYDGFNWDYGRKQVPSATQAMLKGIAEDQFRELTYWRKFVGGSSKTPPAKPAQVSRLQREDRFGGLKGLPSLNFEEISFLKSPNNQEAGVAGIFHELIGSGILDNYRCLRAGYKQDYDFWGIYTPEKDSLGSKIQEEDLPDQIKEPIVIEFKYDCKDIIPDIENRTKHFNDIDLIVCWQVDRDDFEGTGITVEPVSDDEVFFVGSNYKLVPNSANEWNDTQKYVLALTDFIDDYKTN